MILTEFSVHPGRSPYFANLPTQSANDQTSSQQVPRPHSVSSLIADDWERFKKQAHSKLYLWFSFGIGLTEFSAHPGRSSYFPNTLSRQSAGGQTRSQQVPHPSPLVDGTLNLLAAHSDAPLVRWLRKHSNEPLAAGKRWIVERYQFGISMFDPPGLTARYKLLTGWHGGKWINYWTETKHRSKKKGPEQGSGSGGNEHEEMTLSRRSSVSSAGWMDNDTALITNGIVTSPAIGNAADSLSETSSVLSSSSSATSESRTNDPEVRSLVRKEGKEEDPWAKFLKKAEKGTKPKRGHHFVVLPHGIGERFGGKDNWECVEIGGVEDEVNAHLGLFIPGRNLDYEGLVDRVGTKVLSWFENLPKVIV